MTPLADLPPEERWTCGRCDVTYRIGPPRTERSELGRCNPCGLPFWCGSDKDGIIIMGMERKPT